MRLIVLPKMHNNKLFWRNKFALGLCIFVAILWLYLWFIDERCQQNNLIEGSFYVEIKEKDRISQEYKSVIKFKNIDLQYQMDIPKEEQCPPGTNLLILMMSRRNAFESRKNIRETWAKDAPSYMTMRYLIADPPKDKKDSNTTIEEDKILEKEQSENGDLIFIRGFEDIYGHIHLKWYAGLEWHQQFCPRVDWILKADDDTVVHLPRLDYWIEHKFRGELAKNPATFFGFVNDGMEAIRDNKSKWYVSEQDFPDKMFPIYLRGATYLASRPAISATMPHTNKTNGFNMDDVLYMGILAELGNVTISRHNDKFGLYLLSILEGKEKMDCEDGFLKTISMFGIKPANMSEAYKLLWTQKCDQRSIEKQD